MIKNYFKIAWRNITKYKVYAGINILGLAIGIAACLLILQYVAFEMSYENFHTNKDRIFRIKQERYEKGKLSTEWAAGAFAVGNAFKDAVPEIEDFVKIVGNGPVVIALNNQPLKIKKTFFASSSFFNIFSYPLLEGDSKTALVEPYTAVISETTARKLFGNINVVGKTLDLNRFGNYKVTGVFKDMPVNTQLKPDILLSYTSFLKLNFNSTPETAWFWDGCMTYVLLRKDADPKKVEAKFPAIVNKLAGADFKKYNASATYLLQPLSDIHLYSHFMSEPEPNGDGKTVYLLFVTAFFIIVIAWVNYINLATARAINRAKEVGVRKAIGSQRWQLVAQFLFESILLNGLALVLALFFMVIAMPGFNHLSGQQLSFSLLSEGNFWIALTTLFVIGIVCSGLYPAFVLSGFKPVTVLKGKMSATGKGAFLRKSMVVFQFSASLFLLVGILTVYKQLQFMRTQTLGVNIDQKLIVSPPMVWNDSTFLLQLTAFKEELLGHSSIHGVSVSSAVPGDAVRWNAGGITLLGADVSTGKQYRVIGADYDYMNVYGLKLLAGHLFSKDFGADPQAVIFNRKGIEQLGFNKPEEAIGKEINFWGQRYKIVGVTENFHQQSLREAYEPIIIRLIPDIVGYCSIKINPGQPGETINEVKAAWDKFFPGNTFDYFFLDEHFDEQYKADQRFSQVFGLFTILAIIVACLGLFGLVSYTTLQRTKEIGIRKVLGASAGGILKLLYREFVILLLIAFVLAVPLAWYAAYQWLQNYAFHINIHWSYFVIPFFCIVVIALLAVSFQSLKAALANPVKSLRTE